MRQIPRLFVAQPLAAGTTVTLEGPQAHYLLNVLRLQPGAQLLLLDDATGEWRALLASRTKRAAELHVVALERPRDAPPDLWLLAAPIKGPRWDWVAEKATELGVAKLIPVLTERTINRHPNAERTRAHMVEAAEQCGRTALPELAAAVALPALLAAWDSTRALLFADEQAAGPRPAMPGAPAPAAILIGPEGGFSEAERAAIRAHPAAAPFGLGPNILRADTAAVAAIALWLAANAPVAA